MVDLAERFWSKVNKTETCWLWAASRTGRGYGKFAVTRLNIRGAHCVAYELVVGPIPAGAELDHTCHVKHCVNPAHLRPTTHSENLQNRRGANRNSKSGIRGVSWDKASGKWLVQIQVRKIRHSAGLFADLEDAETAAKRLRNTLMTHNDTDKMKEK